MCLEEVVLKKSLEHNLRLAAQHAFVSSTKGFVGLGALSSSVFIFFSPAHPIQIPVEEESEGLQTLGG